MNKTITFIILLFATSIFSQEQITLNDCYQLLTTNFPLVKQNALLESQNTLEKNTIKAANLPEINISAQATYQSDVIEIPIQNAGITPLNKNQYRTTIYVNQLIYGGGIIDASLNAKSVNLKTKQKQVEVNLYQLKKQVNQLYFSVLLTQDKKDLLIEKKTLLNSKLKEIKSGIKNGVLLPTSDKIIEVELLKVSQHFSEIELNKASLIKTLSSLIGKDINRNSSFEKTIIVTEFNTEISRPELELFQLKKEQIETSENLISKENSPKLIGFANGGYGNPGLNMLDNSFQSFYTVGIKLNWKILDWNANKMKRESLIINKDIIDTEAEIFKLNTNIELEQQQSEIQKLEGFIASDLDIIQLRKDVLKSSASQLKNGVITSSSYITELTNLYEDENMLSTHKIQLQLAKANYNITKGK
jgi:outer membrane protein TolC